MKKILSFFLLIIIVFGLYIGYRIIRRNNLLNSGENILLVDRFDDVYINTDSFPRDAITWKLKAVGSLDKMSEQEINKYTKGKVFIFIDPEILSYTGAGGRKLDNDAINDFQNALALLSAEQDSMCKKIEKPDIFQDCLMRHYIFKLLKASQDSSACERIFVDRWEDECVEAAANSQSQFFIDEDANNLLDNYEIIAFPEIIE